MNFLLYEPLTFIYYYRWNKLFFPYIGGVWTFHFMNFQLYDGIKDK